MSMRAIAIRVPGTTSNLGPGFDTFGLALQVYNTVTVRPGGKSLTVRTGPQGTPGDEGAQLMAGEAARAFFRRTRQRTVPVEVRIAGDVPVARGLGSSVTLRLGVVAGLNALCRGRLSRQDLLDVVNELEHHPDNAAPAIFGGFTIAGSAGGGVRCLRFPVSGRMRFVTLIPPFEVSTARARRLVPERFSKADTVHNLNRAAFIGAAFASERYAELRGLFDDRVHQPYRKKLIPQLYHVIGAGEAAGAIGGWLSGSGSTIMCLAAAARSRAVARAMGAQMPGAEVRILAADNAGFQVLRGLGA